MSTSEQATQQDYVEQCQRAAKKGNVVAQNTLGFLYLHGQGIGQDDKAAAKWFKIAADNGYAAAQYNLAVMYKLGQGLLQSHPESIRWMQASANQNYTDAQVNLGNAYYQGVGVMQDYVMAYHWWTLAEQSGAKDVGHNKYDLLAKMSERDIELAKQSVAQWTIKH